MQKILIIQTAFIGDAILTLPMIEKISEQFPSSQIDVLAIPASVEIFNASPYVNFVWNYDKRGENKSFKSLLKLIKQIRAVKYERIISPHRSLRTTIISFLGKARTTISFNKSAFSFLYSEKVEYFSSKHEVQRNLDLIDYKYDEQSWKIIPKIEIDVKGGKNLLPYKSFFADRTVAIAPGSVWETKKYPAEYFKEIISILISKNYNILLIGGKSDLTLCNKLSMINNGKILNLCGKLSIIESIEILKKCKLLISNDSAPTHMGVCADISVLMLYCSTVPEFGFYPYNNKSSWMSLEDIKCKPCGIHGKNECPQKTFECGKNLVPALVLKKINTMGI